MTIDLSKYEPMCINRSDIEVNEEEKFLLYKPTNYKYDIENYRTLYSSVGYFIDHLHRKYNEHKYDELKDLIKDKRGRYLLFQYMAYENCGGMNDLTARSDNLEALKRLILLKKEPINDIFDLETNEYVQLDI